MSNVKRSTFELIYKSASGRIGSGICNGLCLWNRLGTCHVNMNFTLWLEKESTYLSLAFKKAAVCSVSRPQLAHLTLACQGAGGRELFTLVFSKALFSRSALDFKTCEVRMQHKMPAKWPPNSAGNVVKVCHFQYWHTVRSRGYQPH